LVWFLSSATDSLLGFTPNQQASKSILFVREAFVSLQEWYHQLPVKQAKKDIEREVHH